MRAGFGVRVLTCSGVRFAHGSNHGQKGASAEPVGGLLIGTAGFSGLLVSTVAGTMAGSGAGVQPRVVWQIVIARVATLPATIILSGGLFWLFAAG